MPEQAIEIAVTNTVQPVVIVISAVAESERALDAVVTAVASQTVVLTPASE